MAINGGNSVKIVLHRLICKYALHVNIYGPFWSYSKKRLTLKRR